MDIASFEDEIKREGYAEIQTKTLAAGTAVGEHEHPFDVRALVLEGEIELTVAGTRRKYGAGELFSMAAGCKHAEQIGAAGVSYIVGRRHPGTQAD